MFYLASRCQASRARRLICWSTMSYDLVCRRRCTVASTFVWLALLAGPARAEPGPRHPTFLTLDRMDGAPRAGLDLGFATLSDAGSGNVFIGAGLWGQALVGHEGFGVYGSLPLSFAVVENESDQTAIGNIE